MNSVVKSKKLKMKYTIYILLLFTIVSCTKDFEDINTNPNAPVQVSPDLLLRQVIYDFGDEMAYEGFVAGNLLGQYFTAIDFNLFDRHSLTEPQFGGNPWPTIYTNLRDNQLMLQTAQENPAFDVYQGPGLILKAYMTSVLTDIYGDVPYSEALQGNNGIVTPRYDTQESIYLDTDGIIDNLDKGIGLLNSYEGTTALNGDILFNGDLEAWIRFANSLKIKALMRISDQVDINTDIQNIVNAGNFIQSNDQNATFDFAASQPNNFRMANLRAGDFNLFIMSETMEEILNDLNDPRIETFFRPTSNDATRYVGLLNGPDASQTSISVADYSLSGTIFREAPADLDANFITAWETAFLLAEAAERGFINADPKAYYDAGIEMAFEYWNTEMPTDYLSNERVDFAENGNDPIEQIITQKWIANIINGYEGWIDYRRTGFPELKIISASLNNDMIPVRMPYPADEATLNNVNFQTATSQNDNSVNAPVWWDVD